MSDIALTFAIVAAVVVLFVWNRIPVVLVALGTALALYATGVLDLSQALAGLGDPAVIFIASLFVVSAGLDATGVTAWAGQLLIAKAGESLTRLLILIMVLVSLLTALISVNGAVAALLPVVVVMAIRLNRPTSQLLMPLVFSAHAGALLALTGSPVNFLVSEAGVDASVGGFGYFEFAIVGIPLLLGTMAIVVLFGQRLLPERNGRAMPTDLSRHARTLSEQYRLDDGLFQLRVRSSSPYVGAPQTAVDLEEYAGLTLVGVQDGDGNGPLGRRPISAGDILIVRGDAGATASLAADRALAFRLEDSGSDASELLFNRASGLAEVVIPPRSGMIGQTVFPGMVTTSGDLIILAVQRRGENQGPNETVLAAGDTLLLQGTWKALDIHLDRPRRLGRRLAGARASASRAHGHGGEAGHRRAPRDGGPPRHRCRAGGHCGAGRRLRYGPAGGAHGRTSIPCHQLDDGHSGRCHDSAVDRHGPEWGRCRHGGDTRARGRQRRSICPAGRALRTDSHPRPAHQQHSDRAHRHPDRGVRRHRHGAVSPRRY